MRFIRMFTGEDGQTHFEELAAALKAAEKNSAFSEITGVQGASLAALPAGGHEGDYHNAPRRQLVIYLTGSRELVSSNGERLVVVPGDIVLAEDTTGQGHRTRTVSDPQQFLQIYLDADVPIENLFSAPASANPAAPGNPGDPPGHLGSVRKSDWGSPRD